MNLLAFLIVGVAAGWIAGNLLKGRGFGLMGNMVVGVVTNRGHSPIAK